MCAAAADCASAYCDAAKTCGDNPYAPNGCFKWYGNGTLQSAIDAHACVLILPGTYSLGAKIVIPAGRTVTGEVGARNSTILQASNAIDEMVWMSGPGQRTVSHLTLDGQWIVIRLLGFNNYTLDNVVLKNAVCDGLNINGEGVVIQNSEIAYNSQDASGNGICNSAAAPFGSGIYCQGYPAVINANVQILNNLIHDNYGMGIDINGCHYGTISGNNIYNNNSVAAISLYGASHWTVTGNVVAHPHEANAGAISHPACEGGPSASDRPRSRSARTPM